MIFMKVVGMTVNIMEVFIWMVIIMDIAKGLKILMVLVTGIVIILEILIIVDYEVSRLKMVIM